MQLVKGKATSHLECLLKFVQLVSESRLLLVLDPLYFPFSYSSFFLLPLMRVIWLHTQWDWGANSILAQILYFLWTFNDSNIPCYNVMNHFVCLFWSSKDYFLFLFHSVMDAFLKICFIALWSFRIFKGAVIFILVPFSFFHFFLEGHASSTALEGEGS